jgi:hypothetical protein
LNLTHRIINTDGCSIILKQSVLVKYIASNGNIIRRGAGDKNNRSELLLILRELVILNLNLALRIIV